MELTRRGHWDQVYSTKPANSVSWYQPTPDTSLRTLDDFGVPSTASLIDIGGGASSLIDNLLARGWSDLTVLDIAAPAFEVTKARLGDAAGHVRWLVADVTRWSPDRTFDVWHDRAVFHFLNESEERDLYRSALESGTAPGALVVVATFAPDGPERCSGLPVRRYDAAKLAAELGSAFTLEREWREEHRTPGGGGSGVSMVRTAPALTMPSNGEVPPPILRDKHHRVASEFTPESLLREACRQKELDGATVPGVCVLDPDGDIVRHLRATGAARLDASWACYHSELYRFERDGREYGIVGCAVGAPCAVLVAEQMFAAGCELLVSITSSGQITPLGPPPYFILIDRALRDEGTSCHYLPPSDYADADARLVDAVLAGLCGVGEPINRGATWTTDAPFRETRAAIEAAKASGILAVEMEAAALYAFARARERSVLCFAHVTNQMGREGDFEKGEANGATAALRLIAAVTKNVSGPKDRFEAP